MTFEQRCERFVKNSKNEHNRYKFVYRVIFLNKKIKEYEEDSFLQGSKKRTEDLLKYKRIVKE